ncbi:L10-interacting MYB domain-containing protein-like [Camellia sinensis]|uniref:L10-interacting MYB domain-containing protein-like n=1 Tax=Camellia sinensis TaxID=4442 RepID=UPI0010359591|nr:L10-interacting MYB domain-containing protein-like [Camellia sinensis]
MSTEQETQSENRKNKGKSSQVPSTKAHWDAKSNEIFIKLCVDQVKVGHRPGTHLDRVGWENVITLFETMNGKTYQRLQMKNHWDVLKKDWLLWNNLLRGEIGLGCDTLTGAITASDEWWTNKLERYPDAAKFRRMPLQFSEDLDILFSDAAATGEWAYTPSSGVMLDIDDNVEEFHTLYDAEYDDDALESNKKKFTGTTLLNKTLARIVNVVESSSATSTQTSSRYPSIADCLAMLENIPGVSPDDELYVWAARLFLGDKRWECFMSLPTDEVRLRFLKLEIEMEKTTTGILKMSNSDEDQWNDDHDDKDTNDEDNTSQTQQNNNMLLAMAATVAATYTNYGLQTGRQFSVQEQVAIFLFIVGGDI